MLSEPSGPSGSQGLRSSGPVRAVVSGIEGDIVAGVAVGGGATRSEVAGGRWETSRGAVIGWGVAVG